MSFLKRDTDFGSGEHISVISAECNFQGVLNVQGSLRVDGKLEGSVDNARHIVVGEHGIVKGDLSAKTVILSGRVEGNVCAENLEVLSTSQIVGDIRAQKILVEEGATLEGKIFVSPVAQEACPEPEEKEEKQQKENSSNEKEKKSK
ncbi:cytoskeletal protein CcmA (bactofilin family) [Elusimicrobium posterum]|uniref:bactofilin family protein n=1 Tax=Elusimicrobium posterum TaxID=3116653 RepID=UPI003C788092